MRFVARRSDSDAGVPDGPGTTRRARRGTSTSNFGVSRRESHDSSDFYARFSAPVVDLESLPAGPEVSRAVDDIICGDARSMDRVPDSSAALVVTSPPYFAGKEYEEAMGEGHIPASYLEYLDMLTDVFAECVRCLEPGGRIAVNVANLGRRPFRSLSADVTAVLQDRLGMLLRGEVIWHKQRGAGGNCAWGSFQRPGNPVLRDLTERVVIASKGRFDRAVPAAKRSTVGLPSMATISRDEFMDATLDVWDFPAESAARVGHPAPFPVALPERLINLYTYEGDLVVDPFMGSGTTAVAAVRTGRHYAGYDTDADYVGLAMERVANVSEGLVDKGRVQLAPGAPPATGLDSVQASRTAGHSTSDLAEAVLRAAGVGELRPGVKLPGGVQADFTFTEAGASWHAIVCGSLSSSRGGLNRSDVLWRSLGTAAVMHSTDPDTAVLLISPEVPTNGTAGAKALTAMCDAGTVAAVLDLGADDPVAALRGLLADEH